MHTIGRVALVVAAAGMSGCGTTAPGSGVATNPPAGVSRGSATAGAGDISGVRTVITPLGLNLHATPAKDGARVGNAEQGTVLSVLDHATDTVHGEWYKVKGASVVGWISADPSLSSPHRFSLFPTDAHDFSALYLDTWTFSESDAVVLFHPQSGGSQTIAVTTGVGDTALGPPGRAGYRVTTYKATEICGVTTTMRSFDRLGSATSAAPTAGSTGNPASSPAAELPLLAHLAQVRIPVDATHTLGVDFVYDGGGQLTDFEDFANSMSFPSPVCRGVPPTPPTGAPPA